MLAKKHRRKIIVNNEIYYWCVKADKGIEPIILSVFSCTEFLFSAEFKYGKEIKSPFTFVYNEEQLQGMHITYEEAPEITPSLVRALILEYNQYAESK